MDLRLTQEQELIRASAREFLEKECPMSRVRSTETASGRYPEELWSKMAEMGFMGIPFDERYGGMGAGLLELGLLLEELGRCRAPVPFFSTVVLCGLSLARFATESQRSDLLPEIIAGRRIATYAAGAGGAWRAAGSDVIARPARNGYTLHGEAWFVPYALSATALLVAAVTEEPAGKGVKVFLLEDRDGRIAREPLETIGAEQTCTVRFQGLRVPNGRVLGSREKGSTVVEAIEAWGAAGKCAEMVGGAQRVLEMSVDYAREREQFGRPIGSFQAVQHHCANMAVDVESSRLITYEALWRLDSGVEASASVSAAKAWVSDAYQRVCTLGHQIHGAIGFTEEHEMPLYFRHARASAAEFGDADYHREQIARKLERKPPGRRLASQSSSGTSAHSA